MNSLFEFVVVYLMAIFTLNLFAISFHHLNLCLALRLNSLVCGTYSVEHNGLRNFFHLTFNHHDVVQSSGNHKFKVSLLALFKSRVDDHFSINACDTYFGDRTFEWNIGASQRSRSSETGNRLRHINTVSGIKCYVYECLCVIIGREERTECTVNKTSDEDFIVRSFSFATCETAGEATCTGKFFFVLHGQRHKVRTGNSVFRAANSGKHHGVAKSGHDCTVGLFSQFTGLQFNHTTIWESNLLSYNIHKFFTFCGRLIASD